jgi:anti-anti-sigma regulatory factor
MNDPIALPAELTIYSAAELRRQLLAHVDAHAEDEACRIDAAAVDQVDAAGLQLLVSLARTLAPLGRTLRLDQPSPALLAACETLGLTACLTEATPERATA